MRHERCRVVRRAVKNLSNPKHREGMAYFDLEGIKRKTGAIAALVVFQPELRTGLTRLGRSRFVRFLRSMDDAQSAEAIIEAVTDLARLKRGAIIAIQGARGGAGGRRWAGDTPTEVPDKRSGCGTHARH